LYLLLQLLLSCLPLSAAVSTTLLLLLLLPGKWKQLCCSIC
jgi:hypothetical protein